MRQTRQGIGRFWVHCSYILRYASSIGHNSHRCPDLSRRLPWRMDVRLLGELLRARRSLSGCTDIIPLSLPGLKQCWNRTWLKGVRWWTFMSLDLFDDDGLLMCNRSLFVVFLLSRKTTIWRHVNCPYKTTKSYKTIKSVRWATNIQTLVHRDIG
jgi:hypothetical protein